MKETVKKVAAKALQGPAYNKAVLPKHFGVAAYTNVKQKFPARGLKVIGVTGTNGKTSTCFMLQKMFSESGIKTGLLSTVAWGVDGELKKQIHHMTSQPIDLLMDRITEMRKQGMELLILEVTSHALAQFRTMGVPIDIAIMTNLTHEHLD
jgi:UDP-N-acetylmuramyl tripeptide synthase